MYRAVLRDYESDSSGATACPGTAECEKYQASAEPRSCPICPLAANRKGDSKFEEEPAVTGAQISEAVIARVVERVEGFAQERQSGRGIESLWDEMTPREWELLKYLDEQRRVTQLVYENEAREMLMLALQIKRAT